MQSSITFLCSNIAAEVAEFKQWLSDGMMNREFSSSFAAQMETLLKEVKEVRSSLDPKNGMHQFLTEVSSLGSNMIELSKLLSGIEFGSMYGPRDQLGHRPVDRPTLPSIGKQGKAPGSRSTS